MFCSHAAMLTRSAALDWTSSSHDEIDRKSPPKSSCCHVSIPHKCIRSQAIPAWVYHGTSNTR